MGAQEKLVEGLGFELLSETEVPESVWGASGSELPLANYYKMRKGKKSAFCGGTELSVPGFTASHPQPALYMSPNPVDAAAGQAGLEEAAKIQPGMKVISRLMDMAFILRMHTFVQTSRTVHLRSE